MSQNPIDPSYYVSCLAGSMIGLEKEGLRVLPDGRLSDRRHPIALGAALTHPCITTDFSEALMELITPPCHSAEDALSSLRETETFAHRNLPDETIWSASMPCPVPNEEQIPIAQYGCSDIGMKKHVYRRGLAQRYGKMMQLIAGVHFNFSFDNNLWPALQQRTGDNGNAQSFIADRYMSTLRNVQRYDWLLLYLFRASPATHRGFTGAREKLERFDRDTYYAPYATSLRMGDIGYSNRLPASHGVFIDCNSLERYIESMRGALETPHPPYEEIGLIIDGRHQQLNTHLLQIENEYYTSIRPKQIPQSEESPLEALSRGGIRYLELRSLDINPFSPSGVEVEQLRFLEVFIHFCLLSESPRHNWESAAINRYNINQTAYFGRDPSLKLACDGESIPLREWAARIFERMQPVAESLDTAHGAAHYSDAMAHHHRLLSAPHMTPSARLLAGMREQGASYSDFILQRSLAHHEYYLTQQLNSARLEYYKALGRHSQRQQLHLERCSHGRFGCGYANHLEKRICGMVKSLRCANGNAC